mgnify:CR=1 FL=1
MPQDEEACRQRASRSSSPASMLASRSNPPRIVSETVGQLADAGAYRGGVRGGKVNVVGALGEARR